MKKRKRLISSFIVVSYLANQSINVFAEELKNIDVSEFKNIVQTNETIDINVKNNNLYEVYLDGSKELSGSGLAENDPVNTLDKALDLVAYGGVIYVTGEVIIPDNVHMPDKLIYIKQQKDKDKGKLKFEKKLYLKHMLYIQDIEIEFSSNDKDCIFLNGSYLEMTNTSIIGKPNIFIGSENEDLEYGRNGFLNIINNNLNNNAIGNINLGGKDGHTIEVASLEVKGVNIEGIVDGENVKERSVVNIAGLSMINKLDNIKKLVIYKEAELNIKEDLDTVRELYVEGAIRIKNGAKINVEHLYGTFAFDVEVPDNETLIEGNYIKSKIFVGDIYLSDKLIREGYRLNIIRGSESIVVDLFNPQSSNISTNYAPVIKNLREIIIREGNTVDLKKGVEAWDFEDGDITEKIVFPEIDLESLPVGKHEVSYEVTDSDGNKTIMNRIIYVIKNASPIIKGAKNITIKIGDVDNFDLLNGITVTDDKDNDLKPEVIGKIEKPSPGTNKDSTITYTVTDSDGNTTTVTRVITVTNQLPVIKGLDEIVIKQGETLDLLSGVIASDEEDGDITKDLVITGVVNINKEGSYLLLYKVVDSDGNTTEIERVVIVERDEEVVPPTEDLESLLPPVIAEAITNNLVSLISGTGAIDDPVEIEFNNISNDKVDSLLSDIKNLNTKINSLENKNGYTFVNISILKESNSNTFKVSDFRDLKEEIHIVLKVKNEYANIADKLREFAKKNIEDSNEDNFNSDVDNNTNKDDNISNNINKDDNISNDTNKDDNISNNNVNNYSINSDNHKPIKDIPNTGDNVSIGMLSSLALLSLLGIILSTFGIKKK